MSRALFDMVNLTRTPAEVFRDPRVLLRAAVARLRRLARPAPREEDVPDYPPAEIV